MSECWKLTLPCTRAEAERLNDDIAELSLLDPCPTLVTREPDEARPGDWEVDAYFGSKPDVATIALIQSFIPSATSAKPQLEMLSDEDWVTVSQQGLDPVIAGRFYVHTSTNKGEVPPDAKTLLIEASRAFGTGGHQTTEGCLWVLDRLRQAGKRFDHIADIGTGTGLLAFAASHLWPRASVTASDIDPVSIDVTVDNAAANHIPLGLHQGKIGLCIAPGTDHALIQRRAPYDLVIANILAGPLIELAPSFAAIIRGGGSLILAGLLDVQVAEVARAYRRCGFRLAGRRDNGDWPCLHLVKRASYSWQRPLRASGRTSQLPGDFGTW